MNVGFAAPILPGKTDAWKRFVKSMARDHLEAYDKSRRRAGIKKEVAWLQHSPQGDNVVVYIEAKDLAKALEHFGKSQEPFDVWFRKMVLEIHGIDLSKLQALPELGWEWLAS